MPTSKLDSIRCRPFPLLPSICMELAVWRMSELLVLGSDKMVFPNSKKLKPRQQTLCNHAFEQQAQALLRLRSNRDCDHAHATAYFHGRSKCCKPPWKPCWIHGGVGNRPLSCFEAKSSQKISCCHGCCSHGSKLQGKLLRPVPQISQMHDCRLQLKSLDLGVSACST